MTSYTSRYSLADYQVTVKIPAIGTGQAETITIGGPGENGQGSCVGEISVTRNSNLWTTEADATGSWVHNKNLDRTGIVRINIRQVSDIVIRLIQVCMAFESADIDSTNGITITVNPVLNNEGTTQFITCNDCFITKIPDQAFGPTAAEQSWEFTCGQVLFGPTLKG